MILFIFNIASWILKWNMWGYRVKLVDFPASRVTYIHSWHITSERLIAANGVADNDLTLAQRKYADASSVCFPRKRRPMTDPAQPTVHYVPVFSCLLDDKAARLTHVTLVIHFPSYRESTFDTCGYVMRIIAMTIYI